MKQQSVHAVRQCVEHDSVQGTTVERALGVTEYQVSLHQWTRVFLVFKSCKNNLSGSGVGVLVVRDLSWYRVHPRISRTEEKTHPTFSLNFWNQGSRPLKTCSPPSGAQAQGERCVLSVGGTLCHGKLSLLAVSSETLCTHPTNSQNAGIVCFPGSCACCRSLPPAP